MKASTSPDLPVLYTYVVLGRSSPSPSPSPSLSPLRTRTSTTSCPYPLVIINPILSYSKRKRMERCRCLGQRSDLVPAQITFCQPPEHQHHPYPIILPKSLNSSTFLPPSSSESKWTSCRSNHKKPPSHMHRPRAHHVQHPPKGPRPQLCTGLTKLRTPTKNQKLAFRFRGTPGRKTLRSGPDELQYRT